MPTQALPVLPRDAVVRLWLERQGLARERGAPGLNRRTFVAHLERTGGLQLDTVNVLARAHYLTLWSRFGSFDPARVDRWVHRERVAYEYWGHEASILPLAQLPFSRRRMRRFPGAWREKAWWPRYETSQASRRRVLRRLRDEGPLESANFERTPEEAGRAAFHWGNLELPKEDKRSLKLLWHAGQVAVHARRHFRCVYDLAERVYPPGPAARQSEVEDRWLQVGLSGNGVASERHLAGYFTTPSLKAADRRRILRRNLRRGQVVAVEIEGVRGPCYALPEHLERLARAPRPTGTTLLSPFDSLLWQRERARELLDFDYRNEIYTPPARRRFGYYVLPILHAGRLVGRLDPKLHRPERAADGAVLEIKRIDTEPGFRGGRAFETGLAGALEDLARFSQAADLRLPRAWQARLRV